MKHLIVLALCLVSLHAAAWADQPEKPAAENGLESPTFGGGGPVTFKRWVLRNLDLSGDEFAEGDVLRGVVSFTVTKNGKLREVDVSRLEPAALARRVGRAIAVSPAWIPASLDGKPQARTMKVRFDLHLERNASGELYAEDDTPYTKADTPPAFRNGGPREFQEWLIRCVDSLLGFSTVDLKYRVSIRFVVERDGSMSEIGLRAKRGYGGTAQSVRGARYAAPVWEPAVLDGEPVRFGAGLTLDFSATTEQPAVADTTTNIPYLIVEEMPQFRGGNLDRFREWVHRTVKYPHELAEHGISGRVVVTFVIEADGALSSVEIIRSPHPLLSKEVERVLSASPRWTPGRQKGQYVRVKYTLPVNFGR